MRCHYLNIDCGITYHAIHRNYVADRVNMTNDHLSSSSSYSSSSSAFIKHHSGDRTQVLGDGRQDQRRRVRVQKQTDRCSSSGCAASYHLFEEPRYWRRVSSSLISSSFLSLTNLIDAEGWKIDTNSITVVGHSFGGGTAATSVVNIPSVTRGISLDGLFEAL